MTAAAFSSVALFVWSRHRHLIVGTAAIYLVIALAFEPLWVREGKPYVVPMLTFLRAAPLFLPLLLFTAAVSVATADLATRDSWYPRPLFTLPLTAHQLALPFMAFAVGLYALLWLVALAVSDGIVLRAGPLDASGSTVSIQPWFPFLNLIALVSAQALIWKPFTRQWTRLVVLFGLAAVYFALLIAAIARIVPGSVIIALGVASVPAAYIVGVRGVARARHADVRPPTARSAAAGSRTRRGALKESFASALAAQAWFEANVQRGRAGFVVVFLLPLIVLLVLLGMFVLGPGPRTVEAAVLARRSAATLLQFVVIVALISGPAFATFDSSTQWNKGSAFAMPSFFAALPLSAGDFAWAKLTTAMRRMARIGAIVLAGAAGLITLAGIDQTWIDLHAALAARVGALEANALVALAAAAFPALLATMTANVVWLGLLGRRWNLVNAIVAMIVVALVVFWGWAAATPERVRWTADMIRTLMPVAAAAKLGALALLVWIAGSRQLYERSRIVRICACWLGAVAAGTAVYLRYAPESGVSIVTVASVLIVVLPVLGIVGAPLALHSNRCR